MPPAFVCATIQSPWISSLMGSPSRSDSTNKSMKELAEICTALQQLGNEPCALATVINVEGSAYRRPGARMLLTPNGRSWGMVSGGCLESDVLDHARRALQSGQPRVVRYDSTSEDDIVLEPASAVTASLTFSSNR